MKVLNDEFILDEIMNHECIVFIIGVFFLFDINVWDW